MRKLMVTGRVASDDGLVRSAAAVTRRHTALPATAMTPRHTALPAAGATAALTLAVLAGCASSPPMHYYTLTSVRGSSTASAPAGAAPIRLDRVTIPSELDRSQLVRRVEPTRLQIIENDRWAAPLDETIRRVLSDDLATRLPAGVIANPNEPSAGEKRQSLTVDFQDFYGDTSCSVTLRASWVLKPVGSAPALHGAEEIKAPAAGDCTAAGSAAVPPAMSQALGMLADKIAAEVGGAH